MDTQRIDDSRLAATLKYDMKPSENMLNQLEGDLAHDLRDARARIATLERDLAAAQAEVVEVREALRNLWGEHPARWSVHMAATCHGDWKRAFDTSAALLSRPAGDRSALEGIVEKAVAEGFIGGRSSTAVCGGRQTLNEKAAIVSRILGKEAAR